MRYWNIDIGNVTVTFSEKDKSKIRYYLRDDFKEDDLYEGWISDYSDRYTKRSKYTTSPNSIGFYIVSKPDRKEFYADFHNLPFYYQNSGYSEYMNLIVNHVRKNHLFHSWESRHINDSPILWEHLAEFVNCLSSVPYKR